MQNIIRFGPIWTRTCFAFESFYGNLIRMKSGTQYEQSHMMLSSAYYLAAKHLKRMLKQDTWKYERILLHRIGVEVEEENSR
jgi:hypothetical protein